jgi:hypothetical protein
MKQTEPHSPWMNAAENGVQELKKGIGLADSTKEALA